MSTAPVRTDTRSRHVARNTLWNLGGALLPIPVALVCIPVLTAALGIERFGALGIAWMVLGYFGLFDFGLSQSTTRFTATEFARRSQDALPSLLLTSFVLHAALGLVGGAFLAALAPWLAHEALSMPPALAAETQTALFWLAASVPVIVVTAAFRGILEGLQRFDLVNLIRVPAAVVNYLGPVVALPFGKSLAVVVSVIVVARFAVLIAYGAACLAVLPRGRAVVDPATARRLAAFGGWLTVSNFLNPLIMAADRFAIAAMVSMTAVAFYITPFEVVTKAWVLSASMMGALFPVLAALSENDPRAVRGICRVSAACLVALAAPAVALLLGCADLLLYGWLGAEFRDGSTGVARLLGVGILINIVAQVPLTALHAVGRADITAKIIAAQLPFYAAATWYCAARFGIDGVAAVWATRAAVDAVLLFAAANAVLPRDDLAQTRAGDAIVKAAVLCAFLGAFWLAALEWRLDLAARGAALALLMLALLAWEWHHLLRPQDRAQLATLWSRLSPTRNR